jgi:hypothetical protein
MFAPSFVIKRTEAQQTSYPVLYVSPPDAYAEPGENVTVSVMIANAINLWLFQVYINYSQDVLEIPRNTTVPVETSPDAYYVYEGDFLRRGSYTTFWVSQVNNTKGELRVWDSMLNPAPEVSGNGELFRVTFHVKKVGGSLIHLFNTALTTMYQVSVPHSTEDGAIATVKMGFSPNLFQGTEYQPGKSFDVDLILSGTIEDLYAFDINVTYRNDILSVDSVTLQPLLGTPNDNLTEINNSEGWVRLSLNCTPPAPSTSTTGSIATLNFTILPAVGETDIVIGGLTLLDAAGNEIVCIREKATFTGGLIRDLKIVDATMSPLSVEAGENVTLSATILNDGPLNETSSIVAHAADDISALIGGPEEFTIEAGETKTLNLTLGTAGLGGNYTISIFVLLVPNEVNVSDNQYTYPSLLSVTPKPESVPSIFGTTFFIAVALVIIVIAIVLVYYLRRKR